MVKELTKSEETTLNYLLAQTGQELLNNLHDQISDRSIGHFQRDMVKKTLYYLTRLNNVRIKEMPQSLTEPLKPSFIKVEVEMPW